MAQTTILLQFNNGSFSIEELVASTGMSLVKLFGKKV